MVAEQTEWVMQRAAICFASRKVQTEGPQDSIEVEVFLADANPDKVRVEL